MNPLHTSNLLGIWHIYGGDADIIFGLGLADLYHVFLFALAIFLIVAQWQAQNYYAYRFLRRHTAVLIGGKMGNGKSWLEMQILADIRQNENNDKRVTMICSNTHCGYADIFFQSRADFVALQDDMATISLYLNFSDEEKKTIEASMPGYFYNENFSKFSKKLKRIERLLDGRALEFATAADEFHNYLYARLFMSNFSKNDGKNLLQNLHQTRHTKQLLLMASQETDAVDLDIRQISDSELEIRYYTPFFRGFRIWKYLNTKYQTDTAQLRQFRRTGFLPTLFFNGFMMYELTEKLVKIANRIIARILAIYARITNRHKIYKISIQNPFIKWKLDYNTRFNINASISVYPEGGLYDAVIRRLEAEKKAEKIVKK